MGLIEIPQLRKLGPNPNHNRNSTLLSLILMVVGRSRVIGCAGADGEERR